MESIELNKSIVCSVLMLGIYYKTERTIIDETEINQYIELLYKVFKKNGIKLNIDFNKNDDFFEEHFFMFKEDSIKIMVLPFVSPASLNNYIKENINQKYLELLENEFIIDMSRSKDEDFLKNINQKEREKIKKLNKETIDLFLKGEMI